MIGSAPWKPIGFYSRIIWQMIENLSRRYDCRLHALLRRSKSLGIIIGILYRIKREKCLANWLASRGRSYRGLFPVERNVFTKKKKDSLAKFSYEKQYFWKNRLLAFEGKNGRYTSTRSIYIYIYKFGKRGRHKLYPTIVVVFQPTFPLPLFRTTFVTFSFDRFVIHVDRRHWFPSMLKLFRDNIYKPRERRRGKKKKKCFSFNQRLLVAAILLPRTNERREKRKFCSVSRVWKSGNFSLRSFYGLVTACKVSRISAASFKTPLIVNGP